MQANAECDEGRPTQGLNNIKLVRNVFSVWLGFFVSALVVFFLTPTMITKLGSERYGFWIFLQSFTGYYGLIDLGLRSGINQSVTRRIAKGDCRALVDFISGIMPIVIRSAFAVFVIVSIFGIFLMVTRISSVIAPAEVFGIVFIQAVAIALTVLLFPFESVLLGCGRYDIAVSISIPFRVASALGLWGSLQFSQSLLLLGMIIFVLNFLEQLTRCLVSVALVPELRWVRAKSDSKEVAELYRTGGWSFIFQVSQNVLISFNAMLSGYWFSVASLVPYNLASSMSDHLNKITVLASRVLFPEFVRIKHHQGIEQTRRLYYISTRLGLAISIMGLLGGICWFDSFMGIWLRSVEDNKQIISTAKSLFFVFSVINIVGAIRAIGFQFLGSEDQVAYLGKMTSAEAGFSVFFAIVFGCYFGIVGLPVGNLFVLVCSTFGFVAPKYARLLGESYVRFLQGILIRPLTFGAAAFIVLMFWVRVSNGIDDWRAFLTLGLIPTIAIFGLLLPLLFSYSEMALFYARLRQWQSTRGSS